MVRTIDWRHDRVVLVDQTLLPERLELVEVADVATLVDAIRRLAVRGAPALGAAGALGVALAAIRGEDVAAAATALRQARPTAVNLAWGVDRALARLPEGAGAMLDEAKAVLDEDEAANRRLGDRGADLLLGLVAPPVRVHTHCNAGALACVGWGTALGVVRALHQRGALGRVYADETRPLLQGARITAFELAELGVDHRLVVDGAGPSVIARGLVDAVVVGADRIAANGDVVNKVGTYPLALAAARAGVPFVVAAPESTVDLATATGADVPIEERSAEEVLGWAGCRTAPAATGAYNPAFDVTPADLVGAVVTERRVVRPAAGERLDDGSPGHAG